MKIEIKQDSSHYVERILSTVYKSAANVTKQHQDLPGVAYSYIGYVPPVIHFLVSGERDIKKGSKLTLEMDGQKVCKQLPAVRVDDLFLEVRDEIIGTNSDGTERKATMYVFRKENAEGELVGYIRIYSGVMTFCSPVLERVAKNSGCDRPREWVKGLTAGGYKLVYIEKYVYPYH